MGLASRLNDQMNGHRAIRTVDADVPKDPAAIKAVQQQRLLKTVEKNTQLQQALATMATSPQELMNVISKALGPAEAEIEFEEQFIYREY